MRLRLDDVGTSATSSRRRFDAVIVSFERKFIFLKTGKVGGSSLEAHLRKFCSSNDIITPMDTDEAELATLGYLPPTPTVYRRVYPWELFERDSQRPNHTYLRKLLGDGRPPWCANWTSHEPAVSVRRKLGRKTWNESYRFTVSRNPWDLVVSLYFWLQAESDSGTTVDQAINLVSRNWEIYTIRNRLAVDRVIRFEHLESDFGDVCEHLGVPRPVELPRLKTGIRPPKLGPRELLTTAQIDRVAKLARREIDYFGYSLAP